MTLNKPTRHVDLELVGTFRQIPCTACSNSMSMEECLAALEENITPSLVHHLITRGAGGPDISPNLMPLCFRHHTEVHKIGLYRFSQKYRFVRTWLEISGWVCQDQRWECAEIQAFLLNAKEA